MNLSGWKKGGLIALILSLLTALGIGGDELREVVDVQSASAAEQTHEIQRKRVKKLREDLIEKLDEQHVRTTERLDRLLDVVIRDRE